MTKVLDMDEFHRVTQQDGVLYFSILADANAAVAKVVGTVGEFNHATTGASKRNIGEPRDYARGHDLALARALREFADSLEDIHPETP